jgi:ribose 5-phosphate isomerase B
LRDFLSGVLREWGHEVVSTSGPASGGESVDYPDVAKTVCARVLDDEGSFGVLVCGTGQGMAMSANSVPGIRAGVVSDVFSARMTREHNDANVLCLGERVLGTELARELLRAFVEGGFAGGRHQRRVSKIDGGIDASIDGEVAAKSGPPGAARESGA